MAQFVCVQRKSGPYCSDKRLETTDPEKKDCIKRVMLECTSEVWQCRSDLLAAMPEFILFRHDSSSGGAKPMEPLDDLQCYTDACLDPLLECFCTGLSGLTCTLCDDNNGFDPGGDDDDPDVIYEDGGVVDYNPITFSDTSAYIPIVFGTVLLGANIIWISEPSYDDEERPTINFAVGICEGVVDRVTKMWIGADLVLDTTSTSAIISPLVAEYDFSVKTFSGSNTQKVAPEMLTSFGRNVGYRGLAVVYIENYPITGVENTMPEIRLEVSTGSSGGTVAWEDTTIVTDATATVVSPYSRRFVTSNATSIELRKETGEVLWQDTVDINTASIRLSPYDDLGYQEDAGTLVWRGGIDRNEKSSLMVGYVADEVGVGRIPDFLSDTRVIGTSDSNTLRVYAAKDNNAALSLISSNTNSSLTTYKFFDIVDIAEGAFEFAPTTRALGIGQESSGDLHLDWYDVKTAPLPSTLIDDGNWETFSLSLSAWGLTDTATLLNAAWLRQISSAVLFFDDAGTYKAVLVDTASPLTPTWVTTVPTSPTGKLNPRSFGEYFEYVAGSIIYSLRLEDGELKTVYDIAEDGAPAYGGMQYFDPHIRVLTYVSAFGKVTYSRPGRAVGEAVTLASIVRSLATRAGLDDTQYDVSNLESITVDGFAITDQASAAGAISQLSEFYHLGLVEASRGVRVIPLTAASSTVIDDDSHAQSFKSRRYTDRLDDINFVRVLYFDKNKEHAVSYQDVYRDIILGEEQGDIGNGITIDIKVFTDALTARLSAEMEMMKRLQNVREYQTILGPRYLAIEPLDFVTMSNGETARVEKFTVDSTLKSSFTAVKDDTSLYSEVPALSAIDFGTYSSTMPYSSKITNMPVVISTPPARDGHNGERVWIGQFNPETSTFGDGFAASPVYWNDPANGPRKRTAATQEAIIGTLVSGLDQFSTAQFSTDRTNEVVIKFAKDIPVGTFSDATYDELLADYTTNLLVVGKEQIQFMSHSIDVDNRTVTFTGLFRGKFGTEWYMRRHQVGELCAYYTPQSFTWTDMTTYPGQLEEVSISLASPTISSIRRTDRRAYSSLREEWYGGIFVYKDHPLRAFYKHWPRVPFRNTLTDSSQIEGIMHGEILRIFFLSSQFDRQQFETAWEEGPGHPYFKLAIPYSDYKQGFSYEIDMTLETSTLYSLGYIDNPSVQSWKLIAPMYMAVVKGLNYKRATGHYLPAGTQFRIQNGAFYDVKFGVTHSVF